MTQVHSQALLDKAFLLEQYRQCNEHLRETDKKRDVTLGVYITATAAFYGLAGRLSADASSLAGPLGLSVGTAGLTILGLIISVLFTAYRWIHGEYMIQSIMMTYAAHFETETKYDWKDVSKLPFHFVWSTLVEFWIFLLLHALIAINTFVYWNVSGQLIMAIVFALVNLAEIVTHISVFTWGEKRRAKGEIDPKRLWITQALFLPDPDDHNKVRFDPSLTKNR